MSTDTVDNTIMIPKVKVPVPPRGKGKKEHKLTEDPHYFAKYYMTKRSIKSPCANCGRLVGRGKLYRHIKTPYCERHSKDSVEIEKLKEAHRQSIVGPPIVHLFEPA